MVAEERVRQVVERGKYAPLYRCLCERSGRQWRVSFTDIEAVLGFTLPESARVHRPWWSNQRNKGDYGHALVWQLAGWKTSAVDLQNESLVFEREEAASNEALPYGSPALASAKVIDFAQAFPPHNPGDWPAGLSLRCEDLYDDRGC